MKARFLFIITLFITQIIVSQSTASTNISSFSIEAPQLNTFKTIWVYLPSDYKTSKTHYPVFYMHDAQNLFDNQTAYAGEWKVDEYLDTLQSKNVIVIGIEHGNENRINELTPFKNEKYGGGQGEDYVSFIKNTLKPHIDTTFRTLKSPEHTTIFGSSLGGLISFYAALKYSDTFGNAGVFSPSFWFSEDIYNFIEIQTIPEYSRFYFLSGTEEGETTVTDMLKVINAIQKKGVSSHCIVSKIVEGGKHNETFWSEEFPEALLWITHQ